MVLPKASAAKPLTSRPREFLVNIDRDGRFFVGARPVAIEDLRGLLRQAAADNPDRQTVIVRADENVPHKFVVAAMNACVEAGIDNYQVQSTVEEAP